MEKIVHICDICRKEMFPNVRNDAYILEKKIEMCDDCISIYDRVYENVLLDIKTRINFSVKYVDLITRIVTMDKFRETFGSDSIRLRDNFLQEMKDLQSIGMIS